MQNLLPIVTAESIDNFVFGLWQTEPFRLSHKTEGGYINNIVKRFSKEPRFFAEMTEPAVEWSHFTAWMNIIYRREDFYRNPTVNDLYYLHEIYHIISMNYTPNLSFEDWSMKMWDNERNASIQSEVEVYFALPEIRETSFPFEIWVDRFLQNKVLLVADIGDNLRFYNTNKLEFQFKLQLVRSAAMIHPIVDDEIENVIANYANMNIIWYRIWKNKYNIVEYFMWNFKQLVYSGNIAGAVEFALNFYNTSELCPFEDEARLFAKILKESKKQ